MLKEKHMSGLACTRIVVGLCALAALGCVAGCPWENNPPAGDGNPALRAFASEQEFLNYFKARVTSRVSRNYGLGGLWGLPTAAPGAEMGDAATSGDQSDDGSYSTTNLQEAGVDESDFLKTDGDYFYLVTGNTIRIVKAYPASELAEVSRVELAGPVGEIYLFGSRLIVLSREDPPQPDGVPAVMPGVWWAESWPPYIPQANVVVTAVDISDPAAPQAIEETKLDGALVSSRLTGGRLFLVLTIVPELPEPLNTFTISALSAEEIVPDVVVDGEARPMLDWEQYYYPGDPDGYFSTAVVTLDAANVEEIIGSVAVMANAGTIYASQNALYVSDDDYDADADYREITELHKFAFDQAAGAVYVGSGAVPGRLLNQFSLSEHEGHLRVATHVNNWRLIVGDGGTVGIGVAVAEPDVAVSSDGAAAQDTEPPPEPDRPYNAVYVLAEGEDNLTVVGSISNIAPGETLYAARFLGARGYLVTFEQIDPLFVLDLSTPSAPAIVGELELPGYSEYLHPFGDDLLIGVGKSIATGPWGGQQVDAVQLSLFDVSDPNQPSVVAQAKLGGAYSQCDVSYTHKAFTFMPESGLLALPVSLTPAGTGVGEWSAPTFEGVAFFQVSESGFTSLGGIEGVGTDGWWWNWWRRGAFINDAAYAITSVGIRTAPLTDLAATTTLELTDVEPPYDDYIVYEGGGGRPSEPALD